MDAPDAASVESVPLDESGCLDADIECRSCGYNLRGVLLDGSCPECMTAVGRSVHGDLLRFSDPAWVDRVARGAQWFVVAILGGIVAGMAMIGVVVASLAMGAITTTAIILVTVVSGALIAVQLYAYWLVTTPDPGRDESRQPFTPRAIARYMLFASTSLGVAESLAGPELAALFASGSGTTVSGLTTRVFAVVSIANWVASLVGIGALLVYARSLALRIPDDRLARQTWIVTWGCLAPMTIAAVVDSIALAIGGTMPTALTIIHGLLALPISVFGIWGLVLVFLFRSRLRAAAANARETWAAPASERPAPVREQETGSAADDPAIRLLLPVGRSALSIIAGYTALFAVLLVPAPIALILGTTAVWHLRRHRDLHGMGRAIFAIVMGAIFTIVLVVLLIAWRWSDA